MRTLKSSLLCIALFIVVSAASAQNTSSESASSPAIKQEGIASFYGIEYAGRSTASGEAYDPKQFTAAHPDFPFGTMLRVTNTQNGLSVSVRVNDRGPFVPGRIIDLSMAAADQLDMLLTGTAPVIIELLPKETGTIEDAAGSISAPRASESPQVAATSDAPSAAPESSPIEVALPDLPQSSAAGPDVQEPESAPAEKPLTVSSAAPSLAEPDTAPSLAEPAAAPSAGPNTAPMPSPAPLAAATAAPTARPVPTASPQPAPKPSARPQPASPSPAKTTAGVQVLPSLPDAHSGKYYLLQVGSWKDSRWAADALQRLQRAGFSPAYERHGEFTRVITEAFPAQQIASVAERLGALGFKTILAREYRNPATR